MIGFFPIIIAVAVLIWGFFSPATASWVFIGLFIAIFEGHSLVMYLTHRSKVSVEPDAPPHFLSAGEINVVRKYPVLILLPFAAMEYARGLSAIPLTSYVWIPWLLYSGLYVQAAIIVVNFFLVGQLVVRIDPRNFFQQAMQRGNTPGWVIDEIQLCESAMSKLHRK
jgi:hypothetical protein